MKICISELGFYYIMNLGLMCFFSCLLSSFIGMGGFVCFFAFYVLLILFIYLFRVVNIQRTFNNRNTFLSPCDGFLAQTLRQDQKNTYIFCCRFFNQYNHYVPCDCYISEIQNLTKNSNYPNGVLFKLSNQTHGDFSIIIEPYGIGEGQKVKVFIEPNMYLNAGDHLASVAFGSRVIIITSFDIDIRLNHYVIANSTTFH